MSGQPGSNPEYHHLKSGMSHVLLAVCLLCLSSPALPSEAAARSACSSEGLAIRYLGVGALDIRYQGFRVLTDPFYTPYSMGSMALMQPYQSSIDSVRAALGEPQADVSGILIGHGHYDHAADVPALKEYLAPTHKLLMSRTARNMLLPGLPAANLLAVNAQDDDVASRADILPAQYLADGWIRVTPARSEHAPQMFGINFFDGNVEQPREQLPTRIWQWRQGQAISWMLEFLVRPYTDEDALYRIFFQSSASGFPVGLIPSDQPVTAVFLAAASFDHVDDYPDGLLKAYQPQQTFFIHWENFFQPWFGDEVTPTPLATLDMGQLLTRSGQHVPTSSLAVAMPGDCYQWP